MTNNLYQTPHINTDIFKCAFIDSQGKEITITPQMIRQACDDIDTKHKNYYAEISKPSACK